MSAGGARRTCRCTSAETEGLWLICAMCQPRLQLCPGSVPYLGLPGPRAEVALLTVKRLKVTVISCPASVHHLRVCWVPGSSSMCCPAMMCCLQSCRARDACGHKGTGTLSGPRVAAGHHATPAPAMEGTRALPGLGSPESGLRTLSGPKSLGRVQGGVGGWQPAPREAGAHIHCPGGDGRERRHQHRERARCGEDLAAALVWEPREGGSEWIWGSPQASVLGFGELGGGHWA